VAQYRSGKALWSERMRLASSPAAEKVAAAG
jgi:hypothetical protein